MFRRSASEQRDGEPQQGLSTASSLVALPLVLFSIGTRVLDYFENCGTSTEFTIEVAKSHPFLLVIYDVGTYQSTGVLHNRSQKQQRRGDSKYLLVNLTSRVVFELTEDSITDTVIWATVYSDYSDYMLYISTGVQVLYQD